MPKLKVPSDVLSESYNRHKSIYRVAAEVGLCPQSVHERLVRLGIRMGNPLSDEEKKAIRDLYASGFKRGEGRVEGLSERLGRSMGTIYQFAYANGLCDVHRGITEELETAGKARFIESFAKQKREGTYKNSMSGKHHSEEGKALISQTSKARWAAMSVDQRAAQSMLAMKTRFKKYGRVGNLMRPGKTTWKSQWVELSGKRFYARSSWEAQYAFYLEFLKRQNVIADWEHEPKIFWFEKIKRGVRSYLPDFEVHTKTGSVEFHEVKGWMCPRSKTTLSRMKKYHPKVIIRVLDGKWFKANKANLSLAHTMCTK